MRERTWSGPAFPRTPGSLASSIDGVRVSQSEGGRRPALPPVTEIPDKLYFRIGEVARLLGVAPYVLRFWESEFPHLKPNKGGTGQRLYRRRDVEAALRIRHLLYDEGYTIDGARKALKADAKSPPPKLPVRSDAELDGRPQGAAAARLRRMQTELQEIAALLSRPSPLLGRAASNGPHGPKRLHLAAPGRQQRASAAAQTEPLFPPDLEMELAELTSGLPSAGALGRGLAVTAATPEGAKPEAGTTGTMRQSSPEA